jgi:hypothetical protein
MAQWKVKSSTLFVLACMLGLMLLIVVLPGVDLPDTAFHRGTAPVIVHTQANSAPLAVSSTLLVRFPEREERSLHAESAIPTDGTAPNFRHILLRSLRC